MLSDREDRYCEEIRKRVVRLSEYLNANQPPKEHNETAAWYKLLTDIKKIQGNHHNDISFTATLLAKAYLKKRFNDVSFDAAGKPQGASGLDIDIQLKNGIRIVGEIKTTIPYLQKDFGAKQRKAFENDFTKLNEAEATDKFMFVTEQATFDILIGAKYKSQIPGVKVVNLLDKNTSQTLRRSAVSPQENTEHKYKHLENFLNELEITDLEITLSFKKIEEILGFRMPNSAYKHPAWWANQSDTSSRPQARSWVSAGFKVADFHQSNESGWVLFKRQYQSQI